MLSSSPWALRECPHLRTVTCLAVTLGFFALVSQGLSHGCRLESTLSPHPLGPDSLSLSRSPSGCVLRVQPLADLWRRAPSPQVAAAPGSSPGWAGGLGAARRPPSPLPAPQTQPPDTPPCSAEGHGGHPVSRCGWGSGGLGLILHPGL